MLAGRRIIKCSFEEIDSLVFNAFFWILGRQVAVMEGITFGGIKQTYSSDSCRLNGFVQVLQSTATMSVSIIPGT